MFKLLPHPLFSRSNPGQEGFWLPLLAMEAARTSHYCEVCDVEFKREGDLIKHEDSHQVCDLEGCTYVASEEVKSSCFEVSIFT